ALQPIAEIHAAGRVRADGVALDEGVVRAARQDYALKAAGGDDVTRPGVRAADDVVGRAFDEDALKVVAHRNSAGNVDADQVSLHHVPVRAAEEGDAVAGVAGDDIAGAGLRPADRVLRGHEGCDAVESIAHVDCAGNVRADVVPLDRVIVGEG